MLYSELAEKFDEIERTSSRLEMATLLSGFFKKVKPSEIRTVIYLSQGKLHPDFHPAELGMSDKLVLKAISATSGTSIDDVEKLWVKEGDPGAVAEMLIGKKKQTTLFAEPLTLERVKKGLLAIEESGGKDSQTKKTKHLAQLLHDSGPIEARYLCRIVTGRMRVGAGAMTIMDALAEAFATKDVRPDIERAYNVTCDLGHVAEVLASGGMDAVGKIQVEINAPLRVMLAERLPSISQVIEKMGGTCAMEYKYDGIRVQAHIGKDSVKLYSRRLEDLTSNFPDIAEALRKQCKAKEAIIEGECVAIDGNTGEMLPFQNVTHRRKKHGMEDAVKEFPVKIFMFDLIYADGKDYTGSPYPERRNLLSGTFELGGQVTLTKMKVVNSQEEGEAFFSKALAAKCEGIMAKSVADNSVYRAGSRGFLWIKYKKDYEAALTDSFDLAVVGAFFGMGKRAGKYGALLMAAYDDETGTYGTVCKLGTGFDDAFLAHMPELLDAHISQDRPQSVDAKMIPDVWFEPAVVLEVVAAEISVSPIHTAAAGMYGDGSGLGLRFPRYTGRIRDDKSPEQSTSVREIGEMFEMQSN